MNRERLLFVAVLAILALWYFALRSDPQFTASAKPRSISLSVRPVRSAQYPERPLRTAAPHGAFTLVTNETEYPRPDLCTELSDPGAGVFVPKRYPLIHVWPPTRHSVSIDRLGRLRRPAAAPSDAAATIELPAAAAVGGGPVGDEEAHERVDTWQSFGSSNRGRVVEIWAKGAPLREPQKLPEPGKAALKDPFYRHLCLLEIEPDRAQAVGVTEVRARLILGDKWAGHVRQRFPAEIRDFKIAAEGSQRGWIAGCKAAVELERTDPGFSRYQSAGKRLLEEGVRDNDKARIAWALYLLGEARTRVPGNAQAALNKILLLMLDAANRLNRQELVLELAFAHLSQFPGEEEVLEYVGGILGSRSFGLHRSAERFYALAPNSTFAQQRRASVLIRLGEFEAARELLESGRAGGGAAVDLLAARVALALGDLEKAESRARRHTGASNPSDRAQAHQILGGAAYARGEAAAAEGHFMGAVAAQPTNSFAVSDLGLALAVQGKAADARVCFARALELDAIDNAVAPKVGEAFLELSGGDFDEARTMLAKLADENPRELLVRVMLGYAHERGGDLGKAAELFRKTLDDDHRYRIAIARLGVVQARRVAAGGGDEQLAKEAEAHLLKAVALNPNDGVLPYVLGRFLLGQGANPRRAKEMFAKAQAAPEREGADAFLPFWAELGRICLDYRNPNVAERTIKARLNTLKDRIKDTMRAGIIESELMKEHEVYAAASEALSIVQETENKVNKTWRFRAKPRDWDFNTRDPMKAAIKSGKLTFWGQVDYAGKQRDFKMEFEHCSVSHRDSSLTGRTFYELHVKGRIPPGCRVDFGVGLVNESRGRKGPTGIQIRRKARTGNAEVRLDGGDHEMWRSLRARDYAEMDKVAWPEGEFRVKVLIERGEQAQKEGRFRLILNDTNVFETQLGEEYGTERSSVFGRGRQNQKVVIYLWAEGNEGLEIPDITVDEVVLTKAKESK